MGLFTAPRTEVAPVYSINLHRLKGKLIVIGWLLLYTNDYAKSGIGRDVEPRVERSSSKVRGGTQIVPVDAGRQWSGRREHRPRGTCRQEIRNQESRGQLGNCRRRHLTRDL